MCEVVSKTLLLKKHCFPQNPLFSPKNHCFPTCALFYPIVLKRKIITAYNIDKVHELPPCMWSVHQLDGEECDDAVFYVLLRAVDAFYEQYNAYPGWLTSQVEADVSKLKVRLP